MYPQVLILDYLNENDFVIELKTKSGGDRLLLAKLRPKGSLNETIKNVLERSGPANIESALTNDILILPRIKFDITRKYSEIENRPLIAPSPNISKDLMLRSAIQNTAFEMNEKGVELSSESAMAFGCAKQQEPIPQHKMIFDKPFLVVLLRTGATTPYFALWLDNPELLVAWK